MNKSDDFAFDYAKDKGTLGYDYDQIYDAAKCGYCNGASELLSIFFSFANDYELKDDKGNVNLDKFLNDFMYELKKYV